MKNISNFKSRLSHRISRTSYDNNTHRSRIIIYFTHFPQVPLLNTFPHLTERGLFADTSKLMSLIEDETAGELFSISRQMKMKRELCFKFIWSGLTKKHPFHSFFLYKILLLHLRRELSLHFLRIVKQIVVHRNQVYSIILYVSGQSARQILEKILQMLIPKEFSVLPTLAETT